MKAMILVLSMAATTAFAGVTTTYQMIGGVPANNLCDAGSVFKTKKPVSVCTKWQETPGYSHGEAYEPSTWTCTASSMQNLVVSKATKVCVEFVANEMETGCKKYAPGVQSSTVVGEVVTNHGEASDVKYFSYTITACGK